MEGPTVDISLREDDERIVVKVRGEIDMATAPSLREALERAAATPASEIHVDLGDVHFMDSTGLRALVTMHETIDRPRRRLVIVCPAGPARRTLEISGLLGVLNVTS